VNDLANMLIVLILAAAMMGCGPKVTAQGEAPSGDPNQVVGHVAWTITDEAGTNLGSGEKDVKLGDMKIDRMTGREVGALTSVEFPLTPPFSMSLSQSEDARQGFGFTARREDQPTFGWDWFTVSGNRATKLQESGELAIEFEGNRISRTEFLTDVSLRVTRMDTSSDPLRPQWRVLIQKGSHVSWPS